MTSLSWKTIRTTLCRWILTARLAPPIPPSHADVSTQGPGGLSQLALFKLLDEHWGHAGFFQWLTHIREEYTDRRNS